MMLSGWGRFPRQDCAVNRPRSEGDARALVCTGPLIARGNGRGYGDCALNAANTVDMLRLNRMLAFDPANGQLVAEAGVLLDDVIRTFLSRGWFPAVTPGTRFVTLGGMIAADVHGKNHHRDGSLGAFVDWLDVLGAEALFARLGEKPLDSVLRPSALAMLRQEGLLAKGWPLRVTPQGMLCLNSILAELLADL